MVCSHSSGGDCQAANASVAAAQTAVNSAQAQLIKGQKDGAQQLAQAQASLSQAQNQLAKDKTSFDAAVVAAENQVKAAQVGVTNARTSLADAQTKASAAVQTAQSQANGAASSLTSAQASYDQTVAPPTKADLDAAKAQVANAEAAVRAAQANLDSATLVSPIDGVVAAINGSVGQWITGGATAATSGSSASDTALFTLISLSNLQVTGQVNEADIAKVKIGDPVTFQVDAFPNKTFTGKVLSIQPVGTTSQNVVNFNVTTSFQSTENATLYPGMTATLTIISAQKNNVLQVPNAALSFPMTAARDGVLGQPTSASEANAKGSNPSSTGTGAQSGTLQIVGRPPAVSADLALAGSSNGIQRGLVFTLEKGKLQPVPVVLGLTNGVSTEIVSGLREGEQVVVGLSGGTTSQAGLAPGFSTVARPAPGGAIYISGKGG